MKIVYAHKGMGNDLWNVRAVGDWFMSDGDHYHTIEMSDDEFNSKYALLENHFIHTDFNYNGVIWKPYNQKQQL